METLRVDKVKHVNWVYDKEADVLDISFGKPQPALSLDLGSGIVLRYLEKSNEIVGFTIIGLIRFSRGKSKLRNSKNFGLRHVLKSEIPMESATPS